MPLNYARSLTGRSRTAKANKHLGFALAFVAGATNAGGYLAVRQYTSHMTGIVSAMADDFALGELQLVLAGLGGLLSFLCGAGFTAVLVNFARQRKLASTYAMPLLVEAGLLLVFGMLGARLAAIAGLFVPATVMLLCFIMGLQNAVITKLSHAEIRTTHVTGIVTDIGIELGKLLYWNPAGVAETDRVVANRARLTTLGTLLGCFFAGGVLGAIGFKFMGYLATVPLAAFLTLIAVLPVVDDLMALWRIEWRKSE